VSRNLNLHREREEPTYRACVLALPVVAANDPGAV
jgi:hypothetical protein